MSKKFKKIKPIYVTKPFLAPLSEYTALLEDIWHCGILTNDGQFVNQFEQKICEKIGISNYTAFSSGTTALQAAIKALDLNGEIITTPFTWIATISAIKMGNCRPVFCDIDKETLNIDIKTIENHITDKTVGIMPVHVFGNPCDINGIKEIADKYKLKIIYDAAHAIGSKHKGKSILSYGDVSALSTHATKLLNSGEGGGCVAENESIIDRLRSFRFFGHNIDKSDILFDGVNGKLTELQSALGIVNLKYLNQVIADRKNKYKYYHSALSVNSIIRFQKIKFGKTNYSYFPIILEDQKILFRIIDRLNDNDIYPRRYFYPSVNAFNKIAGNEEREISENIANHILCLPLYFDLNLKEMDKIIHIINEAI